MRHKRYLRLLLLPLLSLGVFLLSTWSPLAPHPPVASAHAFVIGSVPVDGSTVSTAPAAVRIFFNETIGSASMAQVIAPDGQVVNAAHSSIPRGNPRELDTRLVSQVPQGSYTVRWTALANGDGHTTHGVIGFNIGQSSTGLPGQVILGPSTSNILPEFSLLGVLAIAWEWLVLLALTFWVGIQVTEGFILERRGRFSELFAQARKQALPLQWLCLAALFVGEMISLILRSTLLTQALGGNGIDFTALRQLLIETDYGYLWLLRIAALAAAVAFLWWTTWWQRRNSSTAAQAVKERPASNFSRLRQQVTQEHGITRERITVEEKPPIEQPAAPPLWHAVAWLLLAGFILLTLALSDDTAQLAQPRISAIVLDWLYLVARSAWLGGIAYLGYVLLPLLPVVEPDHHAELLVSLTRRLIPLVVTMLGILLVSALFLAESSLSSPQQLLNDPYARTMLVMFILIALMIVLSIYALFFLRPRLARQAALLPVVGAELPARRTRQSALGHTERRLRRVLSIQTWLGAVVLLCAALMNFFAPPIIFPAINYGSGVQNPGPPSTSTQGVQAQKAGDLSVSLLVLPGRVNYDNTVIITLTDSNGRPVTDAQVQLSINMELMDMGTARQAIKPGNPTYIAIFSQDATFSMFGAWKITVAIQRPNQAPVQTSFTVTLNP